MPNEKLEKLQNFKNQNLSLKRVTSVTVLKFNGFCKQKNI